MFRNFVFLSCPGSALIWFVLHRDLRHWNVDILHVLNTVHFSSAFECEFRSPQAHHTPIAAMPPHTNSGNQRLDALTAAADSFGSMLELAWKGTKPLAMPDGTERRFLLDGDTVVMRAAAEKDGVRVGFGEVCRMPRLWPDVWVLPS